MCVCVCVCVCLLFAHTRWACDNEKDMFPRTICVAYFAFLCLRACARTLLCTYPYSSLVHVCGRVWACFNAGITDADRYPTTTDADQYPTCTDTDVYDTDADLRDEMSWAHAENQTLSPNNIEYADALKIAMIRRGLALLEDGTDGTDDFASKCVVCLQPLDGEVRITLPCNHSFHVVCADHAILEVAEEPGLSGCVLCSLVEQVHVEMQAQEQTDQDSDSDAGAPRDINMVMDMVSIGQLTAPGSGDVRSTPGEVRSTPFPQIQIRSTII